MITKIPFKFDCRKSFVNLHYWGWLTLDPRTVFRGLQNLITTFIYVFTVRYSVQFSKKLPFIHRIELAKSPLQQKKAPIK